VIHRRLAPGSPASPGHPEAGHHGARQGHRATTSDHRTSDRHRSHDGRRTPTRPRFPSVINSGRTLARACRTCTSTCWRSGSSAGRRAKKTDRGTNPGLAWGKRPGAMPLMAGSSDPALQFPAEQETGPALTGTAQPFLLKCMEDFVPPCHLARFERAVDPLTTSRFSSSSMRVAPKSCAGHLGETHERVDVQNRAPAKTFEHALLRLARRQPWWRRPPARAPAPAANHRGSSVPRECRPRS